MQTVTAGHLTMCVILKHDIHHVPFPSIAKEPTSSLGSRLACYTLCLWLFVCPADSSKAQFHLVEMTLWFFVRVSYNPLRKIIKSLKAVCWHQLFQITPNTTVFEEPLAIIPGGSLHIKPVFSPVVWLLMITPVLMGTEAILIEADFYICVTEVNPLCSWWAQFYYR